ncbi:hypothetical protein [Streptomyces avidinii]|uniref:Secreted protein n=1 Tax=Streptomyces avidinii TaxID=1895 RepID=A0ABS4L8K4_STRAV|nr:hypothetical protein [Streptomyces avidinii]MBP2038443.1 hypothetical protein [Streptomyces avidinii]
MPAVSALALAVGVLWWWAVLRLVLAPAESGAVEGAVAVGGWGLGLLPVHCVPGPVRRARHRALRAADGNDGADGAAGSDRGDRNSGSDRNAGATRAWTPHRSGEGSDPS